MESPDPKLTIAITSVGTRGDLQPFIALGMGLRNKGHRVRIVSSRDASQTVREHGLDFHPVDVDIEALMESGAVRDMSRSSHPFQFILHHWKGSRQLKGLMTKAQQEIWAGCESADIIIFHPGMPLGFFAARDGRKLSVMANPFPIVATRDYPAILFYPGPRLGALYNLLTHRICERLFWSMTRSAVKRFLKSHRTSRMDFSTTPIRQQIDSGMPVINGYSPLLFPETSDRPPNVHTTGSWFVDEEPIFRPESALMEFLDSGQTPLYIGFGSMKDMHGFRSTLTLIKNALEITGQRAVVGLGWSRMDPTVSIPDNIHLAGNLPHAWLFPRMRIVVHHGGAGTTAAGLRAGKPTIIIPHNADQPGWGHRVHELGLGPEPIPRSRLTAERLASAIQLALHPRTIEKAARFGDRMRLEKGVDAAVRIIEEGIRKLESSRHRNSPKTDKT